MQFSAFDTVDKLEAAFGHPFREVDLTGPVASLPLEPVLSARIARHRRAAVFSASERVRGDALIAPLLL